MEQQKVATSDAEDRLSAQAPSLAEARPTSHEDKASEGSIRYRIIALVAMLLLAIGALGLGIWSYLH